MGFPENLHRVFTHPGMYVHPVSFGTVTALVEGYDMALHGGLLFGFDEWLVVKVGGGNNLAWPALVLDLAFPGKGNPRKRLGRAKNEEVAINALSKLLEEFLTEREKQDGLRRIFLSHERWLRKQSWYGPKSPGWMKL